MVVVSYSGKEINAKLVYYGCGLCGKTTNLESIYEAVPDVSRGKMVSMKTQSDRTLFFDLLPLDLGEIMGFKTRFLLYTVPGQVFYNATRKLVLKGADAVVFVADSEVGKMEENKESLENLRTNLAEYRVNLDEIPWVIQYNKRDLPNVYSIPELEAALNPGGKVPHFEAVATSGKGVFETFRGISHLLMEKVTKELRRGGSAAPPVRPAQSVDAGGPSRAESVSASAPPGAPARTIAREAQETRAAEPVAPVVGSADYGREIELPNEIPPRTPRESVPFTANVPVDGPPVQEMAPVAARPAPEPVAAAVAQPAPRVAEVRRLQPVPEAVSVQRAAEPVPMPMQRAAEPVPAPRAAEPMPAPRTATQAVPINVVVPVKLPADGTPGEIIIRIVFERKD